MDVGDFEIGGGVTFSVWVKYDSFKHWSRVFDFGNGKTIIISCLHIMGQPVPAVFRTV